MPDPKNLPVDYKWKPEFGTRTGSHQFTNGEYVETTYSHQEYPKLKYHADYIHNKRDGVEYPPTAHAQLVNSAEEEVELGEDWKDSPGEHGIQTAPDAEGQAVLNRQRLAEASNWRSAPGAPAAQVGQKHLAFLQAQGMNVKDMVEAYAFLATLTGAQMKTFMAEVDAWEPEATEPASLKSEKLGTKKVKA